MRLPPMSTESPVPADCLHCGVCCHSRLETYVRVTGEDWDRLGADAERVAHFIGNKAYIRLSRPAVRRAACGTRYGAVLLHRL